MLRNVQAVLQDWFWCCVVTIRAWVVLCFKKWFFIYLKSAVQWRGVSIFKQIHRVDLPLLFFKGGFPSTFSAKPKFHNLDFGLVYFHSFHSNSLLNSHPNNLKHIQILQLLKAQQDPKFQWRGGEKKSDFSPLCFQFSFKFLDGVACCVWSVCSGFDGVFKCQNFVKKARSQEVYFYMCLQN